MRISSYSGDAFFIEFKENTGHGWTKIVVAHREQGLVDSGHQCGRAHGKRRCGICRWLLGEVIGILTHHLVLTIIARDLDPEILIDVERQRLIRQVLQGIHQDLGGDTHLAIVLRFNIHRDLHDRLQVRSYHREFVLFDDKKKILQDGKHRIGVDHTIDLLQLFQEGR